MTITPLNIPEILSILQMDFSESMQKELLDKVDVEINKRREDIISGGKTADEMNVLLDELQHLTISKYHIKQRIVAIKHMKDTRYSEKLVEESVTIRKGFTKKLLPKEEES